MTKKYERWTREERKIATRIVQLQRQADLLRERLLRDRSACSVGHALNAAAKNRRLWNIWTPDEVRALAACALDPDCDLVKASQAVGPRHSAAAVLRKLYYFRAKPRREVEAML